LEIDKKMKNKVSLLMSAALGLSLATLGSAALADSQSKVMIRPHVAHNFAKLPEGVRSPEDITANPDASEDIVTFGSNSFPGPNALTFANDGTLYFSDSFQGAVYRVRDAANCETPCSVETVAHDPLLATPGFPPFGANGVALSNDDSTLFVANTGDDRVLKIALDERKVSVFAEGINGADGLAFDADGKLWVAANQADQILGLDSNGRVIAKLGEYHGISQNGALKGLLFPASLVINHGKLFITNPALPLTPGAGDEPEEDVSQFSVSKIRLRR
jgi:streptogramin lyase